MVNYMSAASVAIVYLIVKMIETRFIKKEEMSMKLLFRDSLVVGLSALAGDFIYHQLSPIGKIVSKTPHVFVNDPDF
jgi:hypothetical protein